MKQPGTIPLARWEIWYQDTFDRETPQSVEVSGEGLILGLVALWERHLSETVQPQGMEGFSRFRLWWIDAGKSVWVNGDLQGAIKLRQWLLGDEGQPRYIVTNKTLESKRSTARETTEYAREPVVASLLESIAETHARLLLAGQNSQPILSIARETRTPAEFIGQISELKARLSQS